MLNNQRRSYFYSPKKLLNRKFAVFVISGVIIIATLLFMALPHKQKASLVSSHSTKLWLPDMTLPVVENNRVHSSAQINEIYNLTPEKSFFIGHLIQNGVSMQLPQTDNTAYSMLNRLYRTDFLSDDMLDNLYEEELPEAVELPKNYHVYTRHKPVTEMQIVINKKPPYFNTNPHIAVVIDDMGVSPKRSRSISSLNAPLTASFLTYAKLLEQQMDLSRQNGQEIILHIPMEPKFNRDVAPDTLTTAMSPDEIRQRLSNMLQRFPDIQGINNHMGSKLTENKELMLAVMDVLKERELFFLDSKTSAQSKAEEAAAESGIACAHRHVFIDNNNNKEYILEQLAKAEKIARKYGLAIAIGHPKTQTFEALKTWLPTLKDKNIKLVHLSEIVAALNNKNIDKNTH